MRGSGSGLGGDETTHGGDRGWGVGAKIEKLYDNGYQTYLLTRKRLVFVWAFDLKGSELLTDFNTRG